MAKACPGPNVWVAVGRRVSSPPPRLPVLVVAGTVTTALEPALVRLFDEHAQRGPVIVVSFGACATSGGPYWDAPTVRPGIEALFPGQEIASYVPGCPPRPEALVVELERLLNSRIPA